MRFILPVVVVLIIVVGVAAIVYGLVGRPPTASQPIAFNHALHLEQAGLQCLDCHTDAETSVTAGIPGKAICLDCHDVDEEVPAGSELAKLPGYADSERDILWQRVAVAPPDVFFSHRRHVASGGIDCLRCHAEQPSMTAPPKTVRMVLTMDECLECHQDSNVSSDCLTCHR